MGLCSAKRLLLCVIGLITFAWGTFMVTYMDTWQIKSVETGDSSNALQVYQSTVNLVPKTEEEKEEERRGFDRNGFNQFVSDRVPLNRAVPDTRDQRCTGRSYPSGLPTTSVVIIFHNEAYTALLRTITSVINRSPNNLLHEIILVDDCSDHDDLMDKLNDYIATQPKVKILRHTKREGLIRARMTGANAATGDTITFLDSHCEANVGWLEPLLHRIYLNRTTVVCPVIDVISWEKLEYSSIRGPPGVRGGFNWGLQFKWRKIPDYEQKRRQGDETREVKSPTMAGGLFTIDTKYFFKIGAYDLGMDIWGGENLEISFRIWMCGGQLELVPCSRVGHIFRKRQPYTFPGGVDHILVKNNQRLVEVWMDEYKEYYYEKRPEIRHRSYGDITDRLQLRERLKCKSFKWFLQTVYPELPLPNQNLYHGGGVHNPHSNLCLDTFGHREGGDISIFSCHGQAGNQEFGFTDLNELQFEDDLCLDVPSHNLGAPVKIYNCHGLGGNQKWEYNLQTHALYHPLSRHCMTVKEKKVVMDSCNAGPEQEWIFTRHYTPSPRIKG